LRYFSSFPLLSLCPRDDFLLSLFLETHELRIDGLHEPAEVFLRANYRLNDRSFDIPANIIECDKLLRIDHRQCYGIIHEGNGYDLVQLNESLRQQTDNVWIEIALQQTDIFDADLFRRVFETLGEDSCQAQGDLGMLG